MFDSTTIKYILFGTSACVLSEVIYQYYLYRKKRLAEMRALEPINDVIFVNEFTDFCEYFNPHDSSTYGKHIDQMCSNMYCFPRNRRKIIDYINQAQFSIDISMYILTADDFYHALLRSKKRNVQIRIISDKEMSQTSGSKVLDLLKAGAGLRFPDSMMIMHHKFCIIDGPIRSREIMEQQKIPFKKIRSIIFNGSMNWTYQGLKHNWENMIITSNLTIIDKFEQEYNRMWAAFEFSKKQQAKVSARDRIR